MMSLFYIKSTKGNVHFYKLLEFARRRMLFLRNIHGKSFQEIVKLIEVADNVERSECLIEGTSKDKASHFILRLVCSSDHDMSDFFIKCETELFQFRLQFYSLSKLKFVLQDACKQSSCILSKVKNSYKQVLKTIISISEQLNTMGTTGANFNVKVYFVNALKFVVKRCYPIQQGFVYVPLQDIKTLLHELFSELLCEGIQHLHKFSFTQKLNEDSRLKYMKSELKDWFQKIVFRQHSIYRTLSISASALKYESLKFPLCMSHLHTLLTSQHRLKHESRIQFTLFLKDIGVPCDEVINIFKEEYSRPMDPQNNSNGCQHSWHESEKRYSYSIRYLFGNKRKGYKSHCCSSLQSSVNEGGCPFANFDSSHLQNYLKVSSNMLPEDIEDLISLSSQKKYGYACASYLAKLEKRSLVTVLGVDVLADVSDSSLCDPIERISHQINRPSDFYKLLQRVT